MRQKDYMLVALAARNTPAAAGFDLLRGNYPASTRFLRCPFFENVLRERSNGTIFVELLAIRPALLKFLRAWKGFHCRLGWISGICQRAASFATPS
jgi:hypothetical protein